MESVGNISLLLNCISVDICLGARGLMEKTKGFKSTVSKFKIISHRSIFVEKVTSYFASNSQSFAKGEQFACVTKNTPF